MTTGLFLGKIATRSGYHAFEYSEYPSLIRGGHNIIEVRISDEKVFSQEKKVDVLVCLNEETYILHKEEVKENGMVVIDQEKIDMTKYRNLVKKFTYVNLPFNKIIKDNGLATVMINNIALGALTYLLGAEISILKSLISEQFARKGEEIINKNIKGVQLGYESVKKSNSDGYHIKIPKTKEVIPQMYISGNEIIGLGSVAAGCKFYAAYPMTPSSALLHYLASKGEKAGMVVKHAEDEISVINMALGASWAGVRSMVGTSGGGFALMVESVSLAGITETPIVVIMGQRPGPATGMPTWTEQGDLLFVLHAGHGEFPKILLAPGDIEEAFKLTIEAFNLADIYQTPVILLGDKYLQEGHQSIEYSRIKNYEFKIDRGKLLKREELDKIKDYKRYLITDDGISPRALPGMKGSLHQVNSYEHIEDGHTTEDAQQRSKQVDKRNRKTETFLKNHTRLPVLYGDKTAPLTIISWGSMKGPVLQAMKEWNGKFNLLHFTYIWPLPQKELTEMLKGLNKTLLIENNSTAQLGQLLKMVTGIELENNKLLKYSGRPIYPEEVLEKVKEMKI